MINSRNSLLAAAAIVGSLICPAAYSQWAVHDQEAVQQLENINRVGKVTSEDAELQKDLVETSKAFHELEIAGEEKEKYIKSLASCGERKVNTMYFDACIGRRKLAINSLMQYDVHLDKMNKHLEAIKKLLENSRSVDDAAGQLQRYQTEIQARQALMLGEAARMQGLMQAYKRRDELYALQMNEAREATVSKPPVNDEAGASRPTAKAPAFRVINMNKPFDKQ
ncbi:hypothetical protein [Hydrogenophaga sp. MI9]|uniref:hypothetical protein n=1 Tax=Hydrogenophaga sp. MI9 TaxID=3453719 RepID=UPI003EEF8936